MSFEHNFTVKEKESTASNAIAVVLRFLLDLPALRWILWPSIFLTLLSSAAPQAFFWALGQYVNCEDKAQIACKANFSDFQFQMSILVIFWIAVVAIIARFLNWLTFELPCQWSTKNVLVKLIRGLAATRVTYFDEHPSGRILNRFVGDFIDLREYGVVRVGDLFQGLVDLIFIAIVVSYSSIWGAVLMIPALIALIYIQRQIAAMSIRSSNLMALARGEFLHRETDLIEGAQVFALYNRVQTLGRRVSQAYNKVAQQLVLNSKIDAWGRFGINSICSIYSTVTLVLISLAASRGQLTMVLAAVLIAAVGRLSSIFPWLFWTTLNIGRAVTNSRRVYEIVDLPAEESTERSPLMPKVISNTESLQGDICFENFSMSYRPDTPKILENLSLKLPVGQHIGIVGRTGSGKSSLLQCLFRMVYVQGGDIKIGGKSLYSLSIESSRALFGLVPQDPYLFSGTVHYNLDPYGTLSKEEIQKALEVVEFPYPIDWQIHEGGKNLSQGERQLLCLARVLLVKSPYVLLDEPTSGIDPISDQKIQRVLKTVFAKRTVISIAHRLETLKDCDLIVELADGKVVHKNDSKILEKPIFGTLATSGA